MFLRAVALGLAVLLAGLRAADAQPAPEAPRPALDLTLYGWLQSLDGRVGAGPLGVDISSGFCDALDAADTVFALMGHAEYRRGGVGVFLAAPTRASASTPSRSGRRPRG